LCVEKKAGCKGNKIIEMEKQLWKNFLKLHRENPPDPVQKLLVMAGLTRHPLKIVKYQYPKLLKYNY
jgi:hypothetical protein